MTRFTALPPKEETQMRWFSLFCFMLLFGLSICGCTEDDSPVAPIAGDPQPDPYTPEAMAALLVGEADWVASGEANGTEAPAVPLVNDANGIVTHFEREVIAGNIAHYSAIVRVGPGPYDQIGVHRVVRESRPNRPIRTPDALFLLHGDLKAFESMFIPGQFSPHLPSDFGIAVYLARHDVDVWGIDQSWNFVPAEESDFSSFADWGLQREVDHLAIGLGIARFSRWLTGNHLDQMPLLGYSSGSLTGYALLNEEAQRPMVARQVGAYVSADCGVRSDDPGFIAAMAGLRDAKRAAYESGQYQDPLIFRTVADLARTDPDGASPFIPGFTNLQVAMFFGGGPVFGVPNAHYHAPVVEGGLPVGFQFITTDQWLDFLENTAAYEPTLFELEYADLLAGADNQFVDHLGEITIPVLDIGGAGGLAPYTAATVSQLGSTDITQTYVSVGGPAPLDYGHIDIFTASNSPDMVWQPILQWVTEHSAAGGKTPQEVAVTE
jgi:hypothetical protein